MFRFSRYSDADVDNDDDGSIAIVIPSDIRAVVVGAE